MRKKIFFLKKMDSNSKYKCLEYWNDRYKEEDHFEWFGDYEKYKHILDQKLKHTDKILVLGIEISLLYY